MKEEKEIQNGFNAGYLIAKHLPDLSEKLQMGLVNKEDDFAKGFIAGAKQLTTEISKTRTRNYDTRHLAKSQKLSDKDKSKDKDRDAREI